MKKYSREDYARMIGIKRKKKKGKGISKRRRNQRGGKRKKNKKVKIKGSPSLYLGLVLGKMLSKKNPNSKQRNAILDTMNGSQMKAVTGVIRRFIASKETESLPKKQLKQLAKDQKFINALIHEKTPLNIKKDILGQKGGFITNLLPTIMKTIGHTLLGGIAGKLF